MFKTLILSIMACCLTLFAALFAAGILTAVILFIDNAIRGYTPAAVAHGGALGLYFICFIFCFPAAIWIAIKKWLKYRR